MHGDSFIENQKYPMKPSSTSSCKRSIGNMALTSLLISELSKPPCVTISISEGVGRCADYIFRDHRNVLNIYIYAPVDARYKNCVEVLKMKPEEATKMIYKVDKARTAYHKRYVKYAPGDLDSKQIMIDSSMLGVKETAEVLAEIVQRRFGL